MLKLSESEIVSGERPAAADRRVISDKDGGESVTVSGQKKKDKLVKEVKLHYLTPVSK